MGLLSDAHLWHKLKLVPHAGPFVGQSDRIQCDSDSPNLRTAVRPATQGSRVMIAVSKMAAAVQPSATLAAGARAKQLQAERVKVFDFSLGEPDSPTPEHICAAAVKAMKDGHTHYTAASGIPQLKTAVSRFYQKT